MLPDFWRSNTPFPRAMGDFRRNMDRFFDNFGSIFEVNPDEARVWDLNVDDKPTEYVVTAEVPGFEPAEIDIQFHNNLLTIKAEKKTHTEKEDSYRSYSRSLTIPTEINCDKITASSKNGLLELHLPKVEPSKAKKIQVKSD